MFENVLEPHKCLMNLYCFDHLLHGFEWFHLKIKGFQRISIVLKQVSMNL